MIAVLIPVLNRPDRVKPLLQSLAASADPDYPARPVFICSADDPAEHKAVGDALNDDRKILMILTGFPAGHGDYARKINLAATHPLVTEPFLLVGADDLRFHPGWARAAIQQHERTGSPVVGTNDLGNPLVMRGGHATHSVVHRDYVALGTVDEPGKLLHEGYSHNWVDNEFIETARARGAFTFAADSHVEHMHPIWRKGKDDATYRKGQERYRDDRRLYLRRRALILQERRRYR